jgi:hypothetical protein
MSLLNVYHLTSKRAYDNFTSSFLYYVVYNISNASGGTRSAVKIVFGVEHEPKITIRKDYIAFPIL